MASDEASLDALVAQVSELAEQHDVNAMKTTVREAEGTRKTAAAEAAAAAAAPAEGASLFVGNLDARTTDQDLRVIFGQCGTIKRLTVLRDRQNVPKGHAFIEFEEPAALARALLKQGQNLHGRPLRVTQKVDFAAQAQHQQQQAPYGGGGGAGAGGRGGGGPAPFRGRGGFGAGGAGAADPMAAFAGGQSNPAQLLAMLAAMMGGAAGAAGAPAFGGGGAPGARGGRGGFPRGGAGRGGGFA